jgi:polyketide-type polyunsaturated fatty acid synthase PfaA
MNRPAIAVVGLASLLPGSDDLAGFWRCLIEARDCFSDVPEQHWRIDDYFDPVPRAKDKTYGRRGGFLPPQPFDALAFGIPPSSLPSTDVAQLLALLIAQRCLADADNGPTARFDRSRTSVILGAAATTALVAHMSGRMARPMWREGLRKLGMEEEQLERACDAIADQFVPWQETTFPGLLGNVIAGRVANRFDLGGTNCALDAACASSLAAVAMAVGELQSGRADTVLTGGVDALNDVLMFLCFSQTQALSVSGDCRPFSDQADGTMLGEGLAMLALRRLEDAERDGHRIYAVLRGIGSSSDGRSKSVYAPRPEGQMLALRRAYAEAGYGPETVELLEAHGTGTVAGDAAEFAALKQVFAEAAPPDRHQWCALGSVKSQIGHTKAAAGAASLVKAVLALHHRILPPTIKVDHPNPAMALAVSPFYLNAAPRPWFSSRTHPRRASVSSFGFGGSNFHVALEEYGGANAAGRLNGSSVWLLLFSAADANALESSLADLPQQLNSEGELESFARESQRAFSPADAVRLALVVGSLEELGAACSEAANLLAGKQDQASGTHCQLAMAPPASPNSLAFLFPGQGSQYVGMGLGLALAFPDAFASWEQAPVELQQAGPSPETRGDWGLAELVYPRSAFSAEERQDQERQLRTTSAAQPALALVSLAGLAVLQRLSLVPAAVAGHSFGELVALHAAGVFDRDVLLDLASARGRAMQTCDPGGGMLAVAAPAATVALLLQEHGDGEIVVANDNHPHQTVISGSIEGLELIAPHLAQAGLATHQLNVAAAFHSPDVAGAAEAFGAHIRKHGFQSPRLPVISNATAAAYGDDPEAVQALLSNQMAQPVRFRETIDALYGQGCRVFLEVGAGDVLSRLTAKCLAGRSHVAISLDHRGSDGLQPFWTAMGQLSVLGFHLDYGALHDTTGPWSPSPAVPAGPTVVSLGGANLGKPYPPASPRGAPPPSRARLPEPPATAPLPRPQLQPSSHQALLANLPPMADPPSLNASGFSRNGASSPSGQHGDTDTSSQAPVQHPSAIPTTVYQQGASVDSSSILEAQRLTQYALLESLRMTLAGLGAQLGQGSTAMPVVSAAPTSSGFGGPIPVALFPQSYPPSAAPASAAPSSAAPSPPPIAGVQPPRAIPFMAPPTAASVPTGSMPMASPPAAALPPPPKRTPAPGDKAPQTVAGAEPTPGLVLAIIAEKTGYPVEALAPELDLEADLGIDSIKRVEILGAVSENFPALDVNAVNPGNIRLVSDLLALLKGAADNPMQAVGQ